MSKTATHKYLRPEDIRRLDAYAFAPKAVAEGYLSGRHRSRSRGPSTEFHDYRQYVPGDDPAFIDWRVFARTDRHYLRTFEQESNTECHILLDSSASMGFGEPANKLEFASYFAAALAYLVIRKGDRVSLTTFDEAPREFFPPGSTRAHLDGILDTLERNTPGSKTSASAVLDKALPLLKRRGSLVVISDFFDSPEQIFTSLAPYLHRGFRVHLFQVLDPTELELGARGLATIEDMETGRRLVAHGPSLRDAYREAIRGHIASIRTLAAARSIDHMLARTDRSHFALFDHLTESA